MAANNAPTQDIGRPDLSWGLPGTWGQGLLTEWFETAGDLIWPQSVVTYGRMRHDPQIKAILSAYKLPILRATWALDPDGCRDEVVSHVSDDIGVGILGDDSSPGPARRRGVIWHRHLREALNYLVFGHMPFERRYEIKGTGPGSAHLINLGARMPWTIAQMHIDDHGTLDYIEQTTQRDPIPGDRLAWYVNEQEGSNWAGMSMLRPAFGAWLLKHETWRVHATSIRRFGMGVPTVEAPPGATQQQVIQAQQLASSMRSGDSAGMGMPQGFKPSLMGMTGSVPDALAFIKYLDVAMAKMVLAGLIELGQTDSGSRALGETFMDLFQLSLQSVADEIATTATSGYPGLPGIITDLVDQNWGEDEPAPRLVCTDVGENYELSADALQKLTLSGAMTPDPALDEYVRKVWRLPKRTDKWVPSSRGLPAGTAISPKAEQALPGAETGFGGGGSAPAKPAAPKSDAAPGGGGKISLAAGPTRRQQEYVEASTWVPDQHQRAWEEALAALLVKYRAIMSAQRSDLVDRVLAAMESGQAANLVVAAPSTGDGAGMVMDAMTEVARQAAQSVVEEAARQGVTIDLTNVAIDAEQLSGVANARTRYAATWMAQQATAKALQVYGPSPKGFVQAADQVDTFLARLGDNQLSQQLGAALTAAQNSARLAVMEAAPQSSGTAKYVAAEFLDKNTCQKCREVDGKTYASLEDASSAYPTGGYAECEGLMRCRGTVVAVWGPDPPTPDSGRYPYKKDDLTKTAAFNPAEPRDPHSGKWWHAGGVIKQTAEQFTDKNGNYTPERAAMHEKIVNGMLAGHKAQDHPVATFFGGGPASGKSSLKSAAPDSAVIDPDEVKKLIPEYGEMVKAGRKDAAPTVHQESSHVAKLAMQRAREKRINYVLDGTGDSSYEKMASKVKAAKDAGYAAHGRYATTDVDEAVRRAELRAQRTGRVVPEPVLRATHASVSRVFEEAMKKGLFDGVELHDNNGPKAKGKKIAELVDGNFKVLDQTAWQKFLAKGLAK
jgi:predicted ABC-type ATPase